MVPAQECFIHAAVFSAIAKALEDSHNPYDIIAREEAKIWTCWWMSQGFVALAFQFTEGDDTNEQS